VGSPEERFERIEEEEVGARSEEEEGEKGLAMGCV
jgi:hypothetical protein